MSDSNKIPTHITVRASPEKRAKLEADAGGMPLGPYVLWRALDPTVPPPRFRKRFPVKDHRELSRGLALIGRIGGLLNQIAKKMNAGAFPLEPETEALLRDALLDVGEIKRAFMNALGLKGDAASSFAEALEDS